MKVLFLNRYGRLGASSRLRSLQFVPGLESAGVECVTAPLTDDEALGGRYAQGRYGFGALCSSYWRRVRLLFRKHDFDLIRIEKEAFPWCPVWFERLALGGVPYVLDYDDATFHRYDQHRSAWVRRIYGRRLDRLMAGAKLVVAGNQYLAMRAQNAGARWVEIIPTVVDIERYDAKKVADRNEDVLKIVWIGSPSTAQYLELLAEPLRNLASQRRFTLRVIGATGVELAGVDTEFVPWSEGVEVAAIRECDIGVMPLFDLPFERGKCGYKLIQYMACGLPVVASPIGVNTEIVKIGEVGFLASSSNDWEKLLGRLLDDADLRARLGRAGRALVEREYSLQSVLPRLLGFLNKAAGADGV